MCQSVWLLLISMLWMLHSSFHTNTCHFSANSNIIEYLQIYRYCNKRSEYLVPESRYISLMPSADVKYCHCISTTQSLGNFKHNTNRCSWNTKINNIWNNISLLTVFTHELRMCVCYFDWANFLSALYLKLPINK